MKVIYAAMLCALLASCSSATKTSTSQNETIQTEQQGDRDGSSFEKAVVVKSIREEYEWVRAHYPDSKMKVQRLVFEKKKPYDVLTL